MTCRCLATHECWAFDKELYPKHWLAYRTTRDDVCCTHWKVTV